MESFVSLWNHVDTHALLSSLNRKTYELFGRRLPAELSMYNEQSHWPCLFATGCVFVAMVYFLPPFLERRHLRLDKNATVDRLSFIHNVFMTIFSAYMLIDCVTKMYVCHALDSVSNYLAFSGTERVFEPAYDVFYWSKYVELVDTLVLIVRRKPIGPLHLFHHATTASVAYVSRRQTLWIGMWTNCLVHVLMYAHFARPVPVIRRYLTSLQIVQLAFAMTTYVNWLLYHAHIPFSEWVYPLLCYGVYLAFFLHFFYTNYVQSKPQSPPRATKHD